MSRARACVQFCARRRPAPAACLVLVAASAIMLLGPAGDWPACSATGRGRRELQTIHTEAKQATSPTLEVGKPIERVIAEGETHSYRVRASSGQFIHAFVRQHGVNVAAALFAPGGEKLLEADTPWTTQEPEWLSYVAAAAGEYRIEVRGVQPGPTAGQYEIELEEQRDATPADEKRVAAGAAFIEGGRLMTAVTAAAAVKKYGEALALYRAMGRRAEEAATLTCLARAQIVLRDRPAIIESYTQALAIYRSLNDRYGESFTLNWLANILAGDQPAKSIEYYEQELAARRAVNYHGDEGWTFNNLGNLNIRLQQYDKALGYLEQARLLVKETKDRRLERLVLENLGAVYNATRNYGKAVDCYEQQLVAIRISKDRAGEGMALFNVGKTYLDWGKPEQAVENFKQSLAVRQELKDRVNEGRTLNNLGYAHTLMGKSEQAIEFYKQALAVSREAADVETEVLVLGNLGGIYLRLNQYEEALSQYEQGVKVARDHKDAAAETRHLWGMAEVSFQQKDYDKAISRLQEGLRLTRANKDPVQSVYALAKIADAHRSLQQWEPALNYYGQALPLYQQMKNRQGEGYALFYIAFCNDALGRDQEAVRVYTQYLPVARELKDRAGEASALVRRAWAHGRQFQYDEALADYGEAAAIYRALSAHKEEAGILRFTGMLYELRGSHQQAIDFLGGALEIVRQSGDRSYEGQTLVLMGGVYERQAIFDQALDLYRQALRVAREEKSRDPEAEGEALLGIADVYTMTGGKTELGLKNLDAALAIFRELKNPYNEAGVMVGLGNICLETSRYQEAIRHYEDSLRISRESNDYFSQTSALIGMGYCYERLRNSEQALKHLRQAMDLARKVGDSGSEAVAYLNIGYVNYRLGQYEVALDHFNQSLAIARKGNYRYAVARSLSYVGDIYVRMGRYQDALGTLEQALVATRQSQDRVAEGRTLIFTGNAYLELKQSGRALPLYERAVEIAREVSSQDDEGQALGKMQEAWQQQSNPRLAIFFGKQAVNAYQEIRGSIRTLDRQSQQTFLKDKEGTYRTLADLLISEGRLLEAEAVLALLKEEEYSTITRRGPGGTGVALNAGETKGANLSRQLAQLARERGDIQTRLDGKTATGDDGRRAGEIDEQIKVANAAFRQVMAEIAQAPPADTRALENVRNLQTLMPDLRALGRGTVALYTVVTGKKGWIMMVTPDSRKAYTMDVAELEQAVRRLREALRDTNSDPLPPAQRLYRMIMEAPQEDGPTLAEDLRVYGATTLMWSLDGVLRYVPVAALHDGKNYLVEKYVNLVFTTASLNHLTATRNGQWRGLGLGVSKPYRNFEALPGVERELRAIFSDEASGQRTGVLAGQVKLNEAFNKKALLDGLRDGVPVVHIASHFSYNVAAEEKSYLLLGDGSELTLEELQDYQNIFEKVDLLTLSACDTAVGGANGKEVEGLAFLSQRLGAKAVVASLWHVEDVGTEVLMREFYRIRSADPRTSKAEAFRRAQLTLLYGGDPTPPAAGRPPGPKAAGDAAHAPRAANARPPFSHPYYWAPFILIGNSK